MSKRNKTTLASVLLTVNQSCALFQDQLSLLRSDFEAFRSLHAKPPAVAESSPSANQATPLASVNVSKGAISSAKTGANRVQVGGDHYKKQRIEHWDWVAANDLDYFQGNITKYVSRWRDKDGLKDLEKARHYLDKYIEIVTAQQQQDK
jgi:hypothetical protein